VSIITIDEVIIIIWLLVMDGSKYISSSISPSRHSSVGIICCWREISVRKTIIKDITAIVVIDLFIIELRFYYVFF